MTRLEQLATENRSLAAQLAVSQAQLHRSLALARCANAAVPWARDVLAEIDRLPSLPQGPEPCLTEGPAR